MTETTQTQQEQAAPVDPSELIDNNASAPAVVPQGDIGDELLVRILEAALMAANSPLSLLQINSLFPLDQQPGKERIVAALDTLVDQCQDRGVELIEVASGWRYQVKRDVHPWVSRLWSERQTKYTRVTMETLALIAYRQPITRGEIEQIRGVAVNSNIIRALEERDWIRVVGHRDVPGRPALLGTTKTFLDYFGLRKLDELPPLSEIKDFEELQPQLNIQIEQAIDDANKERLEHESESHAAELGENENQNENDASVDSSTADATHDASSETDDDTSDTQEND